MDGDGLFQYLQYLYYGYPLLDVAAGIACLVSTQVSSRLAIAGIGFLGQAGLFVLREVIFRTRMVDLRDDNFALLQLTMTAAGLMLSVLVVVGLALAFADISRKLRAVPRPSPDDDDDDRPAWRRR